ncbi:MAG: DUF4838 domain-containing protein [Candidatus Binataceae bacterium]|nr:DUF4838 domain-containing protein [Candidatus Binataceae bacterium]
MKESRGSIAVRHAPAHEGISFAARGLAARLSAMLGVEIVSSPVPGLAGHTVIVELDPQAPQHDPAAETPLSGDSFRIKADQKKIEIVGASGRALLYAIGSLFEELGATFAPWREPAFPQHIEAAALRRIVSRTVAPAFDRRAFVSDLMTWHYSDPARLEEHLSHDRLFVPWMTARGMNAFMFIRHTQDTQLRIDQLNPLLSRFKIDAEYGGHIVQLLMPRELFASHPEFFAAGVAAGDNGARTQRGNFCVSNPEALAIVRDNAIAYVRDYPENRMLHVWGADLRDGGWCRCTQCTALSPQLQYMKVVDTVGAALAQAGIEIPAAYLAYHDTLEPDPALRPRDNVWLEWAPRERCYAHAIDDPACVLNRKYFQWLRQYLDIFEGRAMIFEYYADAILFGGLGCATPDVIVRDLKAYHRLGIRSISCLTFGAFSVFAYPINLEVFARAATSLETDAGGIVAELARLRYPHCAAEITPAYRAIARASAMALRYGDILRPFNDEAQLSLDEIKGAHHELQHAIEAADHLIKHNREPMLIAESELWRYSRDALAAVGNYIAALAEQGAAREAAGQPAIVQLASAFDRMSAIAPEFKGTWGSYDFERFAQVWLDGLRRRLHEQQPRDDNITPAV